VVVLERAEAVRRGLGLASGGAEEKVDEDVGLGVDDEGEVKPEEGRGGELDSILSPPLRSQTMGSDPSSVSSMEAQGKQREREERTSKKTTFSTWRRRRKRPSHPRHCPHRLRLVRRDCLKSREGRYVAGRFVSGRCWKGPSGRTTIVRPANLRAMISKEGRREGNVLIHRGHPMPRHRLRAHRPVLDLDKLKVENEQNEACISI
jgi:hypothetical protein